MTAVAERVQEQGAFPKDFFRQHGVDVIGSPDFQQAGKWNVAQIGNELYLVGKQEPGEGLEPHGIIFSASDEGVSVRMHSIQGDASLGNVTHAIFSPHDLVDVVSDRLKTDNPRLVRAQLDIATGFVREVVQRPNPIPQRKPAA